MYPAEAAGARPGAAAHPRAAGGVRQRAAPDRRVPEPRRGGAGRRAGARVASIASTRSRRRATPTSTPRFSNARMAEDVARKQGGERFSVLYAADLPDDPIEPQPLKIMALALVAGLVLGAGAALGREFLDRSVHDSRALAERIRSAGPRRDSADPGIGPQRAEIMSRIQDILKKAERDGGVHRTRALANPEPRRMAPGRDRRWTRRADRRRRRSPTSAVETPPQPAMPPLAGRRTRRRRCASDVDPRLVAAHAPQSLAAEQYRSLRTRVKSAESGRAHAHHHHHQPEQGRRQEPDRREPRADDGAGVPAAGAARRRRPAPSVDPPALRHRGQRPA